MITEENFIDFQCPHCEEPVSFPREDSGYARACPNCTETLVVPEPGAKAGKKLPLPVTTERLWLRRFRPSDWKDLLEFMADEELFRYMTGGPMDEDDVLRWLEMEHQVKLTTPDQLFYLGIQTKSPEKLVGLMGLRFADPFQVSVHIIINRAWQRQGLGREALEGLFGFCFQGINLHRVAARADCRNLAALNLFEKVGMRREGEFVKDTLTQEGWQTTVWFARLDEEQVGRPPG